MCLGEKGKKITLLKEYKIKKAKEEQLKSLLGSEDKPEEDGIKEEQQQTEMTEEKPSENLPNPEKPVAQEPVNIEPEPQTTAKPQVTTQKPAGMDSRNLSNIIRTEKNSEERLIQFLLLLCK